MRNGLFYRRRLLAMLCLPAAVGLIGCQALWPARGLNARQVEVLQAIGFHAGPDEWELDFSDRILFGSDSDRLQEHAQESVERIGRALASVAVARIRVEGHTDGSGSARYNEGLALRRAQAVADELVAGGMSAAGMVVRGRGSSLPVADNRSEAGRADNRRVAIIVPVP
jgi:outer membrane protein OmpA-like peptidoglycan-associated protein